MNRRSLFKAGLPLAAILILAAGCADHSPTAVELDPASLGANRSATVVKGSGPAVVSHHHEAGSYSAMITHRGGTLDFGIGSITFPAGALKGPTRITAVTDGETVGVTFGPHGTQFPADAMPTLTFVIPGGVPAGAYIAYVDEAGTFIEFVETSRGSTGTTVSGKLPHFSKLVMAVS
jgi:hypothetical protein